MGNLIFDLITNVNRPGSVAARMRRRRFSLFRELVQPLPKPIRILDVGGTQDFWDMTDFGRDSDTSFTIINASNKTVTRPNFEFVLGDARDLSRFRDKEFDIVFSNAVIQYVGDLADQQRMASEIMRVGKRYFVQTANRYLPIDASTIFPFFHLLPTRIQVWLLMRFRLGWLGKCPDKESALTEVAEMPRLLSRSELRQLFPGAHLRPERFLGLAKSFTVYG
jgi:hypothetical protein